MKEIITNKKIFLGTITVTLIFAIIAVSSFFPFVLDPKRIMTKEWIADMLFNTAIVLAVSSSMIFVAMASNSANKDSDIAKARVEFKTSISKISSYTALYQWVKNVLQVNDKRAIVEREMAKLLIPVEVYELSENEILSLTQPQKIGEHFYKAYPLKKLKQVIFLKEKIAKIKFVSPNYYTSVKSIQSEKTLSEMAKNENMKKTLIIVVQLLNKVMMTWISASILGSFVRDVASESLDIAQAWMTFFSRGFAFASSCFLGYNVGCKYNDIEAFYISKRVEVHKMFLEDKTFVEKDEAKEAFKERVREETLLLNDGKEKVCN